VIICADVCVFVSAMHVFAGMILYTHAYSSHLFMHILISREVFDVSDHGALVSAFFGTSLQ
jgi:hypothetical protein